METVKDDLRNSWSGYLGTAGVVTWGQLEWLHEHSWSGSTNTAGVLTWYYDTVRHTIDVLMALLASYVYLIT